MQRVDTDRSVRISPAPNEAVRQCCGQRGHGALEAALQELPAPGREEHDLATRQVPSVEVVIAAGRQLPQTRPVDAHLIHVIEGILGDARLVELVGLRGQVRVVAAVGKDHSGAVIGEVGVGEGARREALGQAAQPGRIRPEAIEDVDAPARARPPAVVLIGHVAEAARDPFDEEQAVEVQQRVRQGQSPGGRAGTEQQGLAVGVGGAVGQGADGRSHLLQFAPSGRHVHPAGGQVFCESQAPPGQLRQGVRGHRVGDAPVVFGRPLAQAALSRRLAQGHIGRPVARRIDLDLVEMEVRAPLQPEPHIAR